MKLLKIILCGLLFYSNHANCQESAVYREAFNYEDTISRQTKKLMIEQKNACYEQFFSTLQQDTMYKKILDQFRDTFKVMRLDTASFGDNALVEHEIDTAFFFSRNKKQCLLIVLNKEIDSLVFGTARMIRGKFNKGKKWQFTPSLEFVFDKSYFDLYAANNFEAISALARFNVLSINSKIDKGCNLNEWFWFRYLPE